MRSPSDPEAAGWGGGVAAEGAAARYLQKNVDVIRLVLAKGLSERGVVIKRMDEAAGDEGVKRLSWRLLQERPGASTGVFIYVPPRTKLSAPLSACFAVDKGAQEVHNVVAIGEGSSVTLFSTCVSAGEGVSHSGFTEIYLGEGAELDLVMIHGWTKRTEVTAETAVLAGEGARFNELYLAFRSPANLTSRVKVVAGRGASALASTLYVAGGGSSTLETHVELAEGASAEVISRVVVARGAAVRQPITIEAKGEGARGHIECRSLKLDPRSTVETVPALRSLHGEAQLTHEAAIGKISQEELEYLTSKGFSEDEAVALLVRGFLELGVRSLPPALKPQVEALLNLISRSARG